MYVITQNCCSDAACVPVCPVNCIHPTPDDPEYATAEMLYIDPDACIDCGACLDVCPVGAIVQEADLEPHQEPFVEINAAWYRDEAHQDYPEQAVKQKVRTRVDSVRERLRVAVVGTGPAGSYAVQELVGQGFDIEVNVFERLPVIGGLIRYGVAPDHGDTKAVADRFARTLRKKGVTVFLNTEVGRDITHQQLLDHHHAVVYAVGAPGSRRLNITGEDLVGSVAATDFVGWYNGHPDHSDRVFDLGTERAVLIGNGNVALDVARILTTPVDVLRRTDIASHALEQLAESKVRDVEVIGRRGPAQAAFTAAELIGLSQIENVDVLVRSDEVDLDDATRGAYAGKPASMDLVKASLIASLPTAGAQAKRVTLRFRLSPTQIVGDDRVAGVTMVRNDMVLDDDGVLAAVPSSESETLDCGLVLRSVGYRGAALEGVPFDDARGIIPNVRGRVVVPPATAHAVGAFAVGWIKRGPSGVIGTNKADARDTVSSVLSDYASGVLPTPPNSQSDLERLLGDHDVIGLAGWRAIDAHERAVGGEQSRPRAKLVDIAAMRAVARTGA